MWSRPFPPRQPAATAATRWPILGWSGSMSMGKSARGGPETSPGRSSRRPCGGQARRGASAAWPSCSATWRTCTTCCAAVKRTMPTRPAAISAIAAQERAGVFGQGPTIDRQPCDNRTAMLEPSISSGIGLPYSWTAIRRPATGKWESRAAKRFVPGVGLGNLKIDPSLQLSQGGHRLGTAGDDFGEAEGG